MQLSHIELFTKLRQAREVIDALLLRAADAQGRSALLAEMLQFLWPGEALSACVLREGGDVWASALDEAGAPRPEWAALIRDELARRWAAVGDAAAVRTPLLQALGLTGLVLAREDVRFRDKVYGALLLAVPEGGSDAAAVRALLAACAQHLALSLEIEALERERAALADESAGNMRMAEVGETSIPVAHEFNNFLNALLLHTAVLKMQLPEATHQGLSDLRQQAMAAAALIQQAQQYRRRQTSSHVLIDLNRAVRAAVDGLGGRPPGRDGGREATVPVAVFSGTTKGTGAALVTVYLDLSPGEPAAPGTFAEMKRLCVFLIRNAAGAATTNDGGVVVRTACEAEKTTLRVEDEGPAIAAEGLPYVFEPSATGREGTSAVELAACKTLTRHLQGSIRVENRAQGGVAFVVEWATEQARPE